MTWPIRSAVVALALSVPGMCGWGASAAGMSAPVATAFAPAVGAPAELSRIDPFDVSTVTDGASPSTAPGAGAGNAFTGEDNDGDDASGATSAAIILCDGSFTAAFDESQDFSERSFLAPPTTGPPAA